MMNHNIYNTETLPHNWSRQRPIVRPLSFGSSLLRVGFGGEGINRGVERRAVAMTEPVEE
jgi:hypothetical protein